MISGGANVDLTFQKETLFWVNEPKNYTIEESKIVIDTEPGTDFWQRTYYGFQNDNAPALLKKTSQPYFSFLVKTEFDSKHRFDQCGVIVYQNSDNWIKASIEYENEEFQRLGSVVTNLGYSDWATTDIPVSQKFMYYRLSRRGRDFCIENSFDGLNYKQMRIAHLFEGENEIQIGIYACSPEHSTFKAAFTDISFTECQWKEHE
jgi:regulation of enolase protein 1 (concanavalin A-like superfamily)